MSGEVGQLAESPIICLCSWFLKNANFRADLDCAGSARSELTLAAGIDQRPHTCTGVAVDPFRPLENVFRSDCWKLLDGVADGKGE